MKRWIMLMLCLCVMFIFSCSKGENTASSGKNTGLVQTEKLLYPIVQKGKWGYIDKSGTIVITPQFDKVRFFSDSLAVVRIGVKWGYIDTSGKIVITPKFDLAMNFKDGLAVVQIGDKWGYIDKSGKYVITPQFDFALNFSDNFLSD